MSRPLDRFIGKAFVRLGAAFITASLVGWRRYLRYRLTPWR